MDPIFRPFSFNGLKLSNRIVMAPMTRARSNENDVITELAPLYYSQRASAGLIITEGVPVSKEARGYSMTPGIYTEEQIAGWKKVTQAVHENKGKIFIQLWHVGRRATKGTTKGTVPLAPSAVKISDKVYGPLQDGTLGMVETDIPKAMTLEDIERTKQDFVQAAKNAVEAGFDGVEIHGAHGYLFDQFMRTDVNQRTDDYGGSIKNRIRFTIETVEDVIEAIGADKVAIRLSPFVSEAPELDSQMPETTIALLKELNRHNLVFVHLSENVATFRPVATSFREKVKEVYQNPIMICGQLTKEIANKLIEKKYADMVAFGRPFIVNPDLVKRMKYNHPLTEVSADKAQTFYGGGAEGYTSYSNYN
ncbi:N-ethylmaleimide reductase [Tenacibaculum litopenaei]|uniref:alkene reductase n=1 Tax=Tenacibaculum litopenaei TaxID=396016 RepID=UPI0038940D5B